MTHEENSAFTTAASGYLSVDTLDHKAAEQQLLAILRDMMTKYNARAFKCSGWMFVPCNKPDGYTSLHVFRENQILGVERMGRRRDDE